MKCFTENSPPFQETGSMMPQWWIARSRRAGEGTQLFTLNCKLHLDSTNLARNRVRTGQAVLTDLTPFWQTKPAYPKVLGHKTSQRLCVLWPSVYFKFLRTLNLTKLIFSTDFMCLHAFLRHNITLWDWYILKIFLAKSISE